MVKFCPKVRQFGYPELSLSFQAGFPSFFRTPLHKVDQNWSMARLRPASTPSGRGFESHATLIKICESGSKVLFTLKVNLTMSLYPEKGHNTHTLSVTKS